MKLPFWKPALCSRLQRENSKLARGAAEPCPFLSALRCRRVSVWEAGHPCQTELPACLASVCQRGRGHPPRQTWGVAGVYTDEQGREAGGSRHRPGRSDQEALALGIGKRFRWRAGECD